MARGNMTFVPVGNSLDNGFDAGGARIYPFSSSLAVEPPAMYSSYLGSANTLPVASPVEATASQAGSTGASPSGLSAAMANPFGNSSPLPWVVVGLFGAVAAMHFLHYKGSKG